MKKRETTIGVIKLAVGVNDPRGLVLDREVDDWVAEAVSDKTDGLLAALSCYFVPGYAVEAGFSVSALDESGRRLFDALIETSGSQELRDTILGFWRL